MIGIPIIQMLEIIITAFFDPVNPFFYSRKIFFLLSIPFRKHIPIRSESYYGWIQDIDGKEGLEI